MITTSAKLAIKATKEKKPFVLFEGDCYELLASLPKGSVDLIVSSPPYFMGKDYDRSTDPQDFVAEHKKLTPFLVRALRTGGSLCWQVGSHVNAGILVPLDYLAYEAFSTHKELILRNRIAWHFEHGFHAQKRFSGRHESILWFTKGANYNFHLDSVRVPQKYPGKRHYKGKKRGEFSGHPDGKNPSDVWAIPNVKSRHQEKTAHPCQFPIAIPQRLIRALTSEGALVLDPFAGVSSTGIAASIENRRFLGCELNHSYAQLGIERFKRLQAGTLKVRDWRSPVQPPNPRQSVAKTPPHFWKRDLDDKNTVVKPNLD